MGPVSADEVGDVSNGSPDQGADDCRRHSAFDHCEPRRRRVGKAPDQSHKSTDHSKAHEADEGASLHSGEAV